MTEEKADQIIRCVKECWWRVGILLTLVLFFSLLLTHGWPVIELSSDLALWVQAGISFVAIGAVVISTRMQVKATTASVKEAHMLTVLRSKGAVLAQFDAVVNELEEVLENMEYNQRNNPAQDIGPTAWAVMGLLHDFKNIDFERVQGSINSIGLEFLQSSDAVRCLEKSKTALQNVSQKGSSVLLDPMKNRMLAEIVNESPERKTEILERYYQSLAFSFKRAVNELIESVLELKKVV